MDCQEALLKINGLMDREIDAETQQAVLLHVKACSRCAKEARIFGILRSKLQQMKLAHTQTTAAALIAHRARVNRVRMFATFGAVMIAFVGLFIYHQKSGLGPQPVVPSQNNLYARLMTISDVHNQIASRQISYEECNGADECCMCLRRYVERFTHDSDLKIIGFMCPCRKYKDVVIVMNYKGELVTARVIEQFSADYPPEMKYGEVQCYALKDKQGNNVAVFCLKKDEAIAMVGKETTPDQFATLLALK